MPEYPFTHRMNFTLRSQITVLGSPVLQATVLHCKAGTLCLCLG